MTLEPSYVLMVSWNIIFHINSYNVCIKKGMTSLNLSVYFTQEAKKFVTELKNK